MPKLGKETLYVRDPQDNDSNIIISFDIHVNSAGLFTTTLKELFKKLITQRRELSFL